MIFEKIFFIYLYLPLKNYLDRDVMSLFPIILKYSFIVSSDTLPDYVQDILEKIKNKTLLLQR
jgi:hypothetical protein